MTEFEKSIIKKVVNGEEFIPSPIFLTQVQKLILSEIEKVKKSKNFIARSPRIGVGGDYIFQ